MVVDFIVTAKVRTSKLRSTGALGLARRMERAGATIVGQHKGKEWHQIAGVVAGVGALAKFTRVMAQEVCEIGELRITQIGDMPW